MFKKGGQTFKPHKKVPESEKQVELQKYAHATLGLGDLKAAVKLPEGEDLNEWLAVNKFCTKESCPIMSAGPKYEYHWADGKTIKKAVAVSAPEYVDLLMSWVQSQLDDETIFPSKIGVPFPTSFQKIVKNIFKRLFRVYAHIYYSHFQSVVSLGEEAHLNTSLKHFIYFVHEFNLIDKKELAPLQSLIQTLCGITLK